MGRASRLGRCQGRQECSYLGQEHHVDAWPQRQAVHGMGHHGAVALFHGGIQENPSGAGGSWGARDQRLEGVLSHLWRKRSCQREGVSSCLASSPHRVHPRLPICHPPCEPRGINFSSPKKSQFLNPCALLRLPWQLPSCCPSLSQHPRGPSAGSQDWIPHGGSGW